jgi:hypothetical protein
LFGGLSGILPEGYSLAEYARRGFFEMATLCGINLAVLVIALRSVRRRGETPLATKLLALLLGCITLFLVATASAKMFLYIGSYGLTRQRLLTQIIMLFLALSTSVVMVWLFVPRLPYMKVIILLALGIGAVVIWTDVDSTVARCNVDAYLCDQLKHIDVFHLSTLGSGAAEHIARLAEEAEDPAVVQAAKQALSQYTLETGDLRSWNWSAAYAQQFIPK